MKKAIILILTIVVTYASMAQVIYVSSTDNNLYKLNMEDCSYEFVTLVNTEVFDISFHPNGNLYGISGNGNFYEIDTINGTTDIIHDFDLIWGFQGFNSMVIASDGLVYVTGGDGELWSYDISTGMD